MDRVAETEKDFVCQNAEQTLKIKEDCYKSEIPLNKVKDLFCSDVSYQTPKIDTRAAIFKDGKILLVHEANGTWALPGGWAASSCLILKRPGMIISEWMNYRILQKKKIIANR